MMRKTVLKAALIFGIIALLAGGAHAIRVYLGDTFAGWGEGGNPLSDEDGIADYHVWSNDKDKTSWSVRWKGADRTQMHNENTQIPGNIVSDTLDSYTWNGSLSVTNGAFASVTPMSGDTHNGDFPAALDFNGDIVFSGDIFENFWDGFDFTLAEPIANDAILNFNLDGVIFASLAGGGGSGGGGGGGGSGAPEGLNLGQEFLPITEPGLFTEDADGMGGSIDFEIEPNNVNSVPEPKAMLLFGTGLIGIAWMNRRKKV